MLRSSRLRFLPCLLFLAFVSAVMPALADDISRIAPTGYVTDLAGVIPSATRERLEALCTELDQKTGAQLAIVTVRSLDDRPVEDYAVDLFKHLGVGAKKQDSGILLLLAPNDRKYRVEVGYGLEPIINDARAGDAGRAMVPLLRQNDFGSAVEIGAWQLAKYIADDKGITLSGAPPARPAPRPPSSSRGSPANILITLFVLFFIFQFFASAARSATGRRSSGLGGCWWILPFLGGGGGGWGGGRGGGSWGGGGGFGGGGGGFGGFGGGSSGGGGASGSW